MQSAAFADNIELKNWTYNHIFTTPVADPENWKGCQALKARVLRRRGGGV